MAAEFEISKDHAGKFRFHLKAPNGEIIAASQGYESKASAEKGIEAIKLKIHDPESNPETIRHRGSGAAAISGGPGIGQGPPFQCSMRWWSGVKPFCTPQSTAWVRLSTLILR